MSLPNDSRAQLDHQSASIPGRVSGRGSSSRNNDADQDGVNNLNNNPPRPATSPRDNCVVNVESSDIKDGILPCDSPTNRSDDEDDSNSNISDTASFPTQEDLESIIVNAPGSVPGDVEVRSVSSIEYGVSFSHTYSSLRSIGSMGSGKVKIGSTTGGSVSSIGEGETKACFAEHDRKPSFSGSDHDHPVSRVMITTFPTLSTETVKSDVATICSGSAMEDIDRLYN